MGRGLPTAAFLGPHTTSQQQAQQKAKSSTKRLASERRRRIGVGGQWPSVGRCPPTPAPPGALAGALPSGGAMRRAKKKLEIYYERGALPPDPRPAGGPGRGLALRAGLLQSAVPVKVASAHLRGHSSQGNQMMNRREKRTHKLPRTFGAPAIRCANTDTSKDSPAGRRRTSLAARCAARSSKVRRRACQQQPESSLANVGTSQASPSCQVRQNEFEQSWRASVRVGDTPPTPLPPAAWQGPCLPAGLSFLHLFTRPQGLSRLVGANHP